MTEDEKTWATLAHLSAFLGYVFPFGNIIGPLILWKAKGNMSPYVDTQAKEALNFQISMTIYFIISACLYVVLIGIILMPIVAAINIIMIIIASLSTYKGENFRYPFCFRMVK